MSHGAVSRAAKRKIAKIPGVVSVGERHGERGTVVVITLNKNEPPNEARFPAHVEGFPVEFDYRGGGIEPLSRSARHRPLIGGIETGLAEVTHMGTMGPPFGTKSDPIISSNRHVWSAGIGSHVIQPSGSVDGEVVGTVDGAPMNAPDGSDLDFAWARSDIDVDPVVYDIGTIKGSRHPRTDEPVEKSGLTTGVTSGTVRTLDATSYLPSGEVREGQVRFDLGSNKGDSGSPIVAESDGHVVAILWGGNHDDVVVGNDIRDVEQATGHTVMSSSGDVDVNDPPVADMELGADSPDATVNPSGSYDPDGEIVQYEVDWDDGNVTTSTGPESHHHTYSESGSYNVTLTVWDDDGASDVDLVLLSIEVAENSAPIADFDVSLDDPTVTIDTSLSWDPDGNIDKHRIEWGDGYISTRPGARTLSHTYDENDTYTISLKVTDTEGLSDTDTHSVVINDVGSDGGGNGGGDTECTYQGYPRSEWGYTGDEQGDFEAWQNCEISTDRFSFITGQGNGTAALVHPDDVNGGSGENDVSGAALLLALGAAALLFGGRDNE